MFIYIYIYIYIINWLPESLQEDEIASNVYNLSNTISNKTFRYKITVNTLTLKILGLMEPV